MKRNLDILVISDLHLGTYGSEADELLAYLDSINADKIVINGDPTQIDLPNKNLSGLDRSKKILGHLDEISIVDFDHTDVVRHPLVSKIVKAYSIKYNND